MFTRSGTGLAVSEGAMPRKRTWLESHGQPINWRRAFFSGVAGTLLMLDFIDLCNMIGLTPFSMEQYLGSVFYTGSSASHWTLGFFVNLTVGGLLSIFYAYNFEYVFKRSGVDLGTKLGFGHAVLAALFVFPFFGVIHEQLGTGRSEERRVGKECRL